MPVPDELLEILVCPETKEPVRIAGPELLTRVNGAVERGTLVTRGGETVRDTLDEALVREDGAVLYPVRESIPIMLIDESVDLTQL